MPIHPAFTPGPLMAGRRAVVTGGAAGIGAAIAHAFAEHGAHVLITDVAEPTELPPGADFVEWDVRTEPEAQILDHRPDVLVNNVGHFLHPPTAFTNADPGFWDELREINLDHALRLTRAVLPGMIARECGSIINVSESASSAEAAARCTRLPGPRELQYA